MAQLRELSLSALHLWDSATTSSQSKLLSRPGKLKLSSGCHKDEVKGLQKLFSFLRPSACDKPELSSRICLALGKLSWAFYRVKPFFPASSLLLCYDCSLRQRGYHPLCSSQPVSSSIV